MAKRGGARSKATLLYSDTMYTPIGAKLLTEQQQKKEYSRLRSIANKRLVRMAETEWVTSQQYILNANKFVKLSEISNNTELRHLLSDVARFVKAETGSVSGLNKQRDKMIKTFNERGYTFVNKQNVRDFTEFMEYARIALVGRLFDSKRIAELYVYAEENGLSNDQLRKVFNKWKKKNSQDPKKIQNRKFGGSDLFR